MSFFLSTKKKQSENIRVATCCYHFYFLYWYIMIILLINLIATAISIDYIGLFFFIRWESSIIYIWWMITELLIIYILYCGYRPNLSLFLEFWFFFHFDYYHTYRKITVILENWSFVCVCVWLSKCWFFVVVVVVTNSLEKLILKDCL